MRFRHFVGMGEELDATISQWIDQGADIHLMTHSQLPDGTITVCFIYQEGFAAQERRLSAAHGQIEAPPIPPIPDPIHVESEGVE
ncbi:MAG TPA: hypothetical protein VFB34_08950 [Chloroflexota bacterium]|nr:hypothetical protein [Chloroflexota bacterium]